MMRRRSVGMLALAVMPLAAPAQAQQLTFIEWVPKRNGTVPSRLPHETTWTDVIPPGRPAYVERQSMGVLRMRLQDGSVRDFDSMHVRVATMAQPPVGPGFPDRGTAGSTGVAPR